MMAGKRRLKQTSITQTREVHEILLAYLVPQLRRRKHVNVIWNFARILKQN